MTTRRKVLPDDFDNNAEHVEVEGVFFELPPLGDADGDDEDGQVGELRQDCAPELVLRGMLPFGILFKRKPCRIRRKIPSRSKKKTNKQMVMHARLESIEQFYLGRGTYAISYPRERIQEGLFM
jgi:hypothetical protein